MRETALRTKSSDGPSGVDANGFRRMLAARRSKKRAQVEVLTQRLCTEFIEPFTIKPILANRLIPLEKEMVKFGRLVLEK